MSSAFGLYLHIPFCRQRCHFCAFYLEVHRETAAADFIRALLIELRLHAADNVCEGRQLGSIYFGGGTPTALRASQLRAILAAVRGTFVLGPECEITVEAHPGTVTGTDLQELRHAGVTRLSFGAESMQDHELAVIGRPGASAETVRAVTAAAEAGFTNINLDLMYGLPGQTLESWLRTLSACCELSPTHLSCYALTVEAGTRLASDIRRDPSRAPDESLQIEMDHMAETVLRQAGYERYEISNYAKRGHECRHNLLYWTQGAYLGLGPSAQSFVAGVRFGNIAHLVAYQAALEEGRLPVEDRSVLTPAEQLRDGVIFGLRLQRGIATARLKGHAENYGCLGVVDDLYARHLIEVEGDHTRLSILGRLHADTVAEKLF
jgi:oxygen-independent coproporphyrinogen III oxidase